MLISNASHFPHDSDFVMPADAARSIGVTLKGGIKVSVLDQGVSMLNCEWAEVVGSNRMKREFLNVGKAVVNAARSWHLDKANAVDKLLLDEVFGYEPCQDSGL